MNREEGHSTSLQVTRLAARGHVCHLPAHLASIHPLQLPLQLIPQRHLLSSQNHPYNLLFD